MHHSCETVDKCTPIFGKLCAEIICVIVLFAAHNTVQGGQPRTWKYENAIDSKVIRESCKSRGKCILVCGVLRCGQKETENAAER